MSKTQKAMGGRATASGRSREIAGLLELLGEGGPRIAFVHGIAGVGKSTLLAAFSANARDTGATVIQLDGAELEPTERGFLSELSSAIGVPDGTPDALFGRLADLGSPVVIAVDTYEAMRLLDTWIRSAFLADMPANTRLVLAGREQPATPWFAAEGVRTLALGPLAPEDAQEILVRAGKSIDEAVRINSAVRGHPLGLAIAATTRDLDLDIVETAVQRVVEELTRTYLADVDPLTREALNAASVVRRVTLPLLAAMLPDIAPQDAYDRLRALPFVNTRRDGAMVHEMIANVVVATLRAVDPDLHRRLRRSAWRHLRREVRTAGTHELWRYTADMLYLIENPIVREAFFPAGAYPLVVEQAKPADVEAIRTVARLHEAPSAATLVDAWWARVPEAFSVVRDPSGAVVGFTCVLTREILTRNPMRDDPVVARWLEHLRASTIPKEQTALFHRWWLGAELGEAPSAVQAATWLDIKRTYMELRPRLRRVYGVVRAIDTYYPTFQKLGFAPLDGDPVEMDSVPNYCAVLDFGPASVDGWLAGLAAAELGIEEEGLFDESQRELVLDGGRVALTKLEAGVFAYLTARGGKPASRADLLADVWGYSFEGSSNVVDVVVRSIRKKLGVRSSAIESVRGVGYRFRADR